MWVTWVLLFICVGLVVLGTCVVLMVVSVGVVSYFVWGVLGYFVLWLLLF